MNYFNKNLKTNFIYIFYGIPVLLNLWFIENFSVNIPFADQWGQVRLLAQFHDGEANLWSLYVQHNEHIILFPRLIMLALAWCSDWNIKVENFCSLLITCISYILLILISKDRRSSHRTYEIHAANISSAFLLFSWMQWQNWLWGFQIAWFLTTCLFLLAIFILFNCTSQPQIIRILGAAVCCFVTSFSLAHGMLTWLALVPAVFYIGSTFKQGLLNACLWASLLGLTIFLYLFEYHILLDDTGINKSIGLTLERASTFILIFLGSPLKDLSGSAPLPVLGAMTLALFGVLSVLCLRSSDQHLIRFTVPFLCIGLYSILSATLVTVGRSDFPTGDASSSRYTTISVLLLISIVYMGFRYISRTLRRFYSSYFVSNLSIGILTGLLIVFVIQSNFKSTISAESMRAMLDRSKDCLEVVHFFDPEKVSNQHCLKVLYPPGGEFVFTQAKELERIGFRQFPNTAQFYDVNEGKNGFIDEPINQSNVPVFSRDQQIDMRGWAALRNQTPQPKIVYFSINDERNFIYSSYIQDIRPDVSQALGNSIYFYSGWQASIPAHLLERGRNTLKAWVYDPIEVSFYMLDNPVVVEVL